MEVTEHATLTHPRLPIPARLTGLLMLVVAAWIVIGWTAGLRRIGRVFGFGLGELMHSLLSPGRTFAGFSLPFMLPITRVTVIVALLCVVALGVAALATFLGRRWALVLSAAAAAVTSGLICLAAIEVPWRQTTGLWVEALGLLVLMALPFWFGSRPARHRRIALFVAGLLCYWAAVGVSYYAVLYTYTEGKIRALAPDPLGIALPPAGAQRIPCRWGPERRVCVPVAYKLLTANKHWTLWRTPGGTLISASPNAPAFVDGARQFGFKSGFNFERAIWTAHSYPGDFVLLKQLSDTVMGMSRLYSWSSRSSRGFACVGRLRADRLWAVFVDVYPAVGKPYTLFSEAGTPRQALQPILASFASPSS